ncbi:MAG TPA: metallophosphoesterase [Polyangia bacterium]|nr:metallophosphoesterase [Polyangia bacterium]
MGRVGSMIVFLLVVVGILAGLHVYVWLRLVRDTQLPPPWSGLALAGLVLLGLAIPVSLFYGRSHPELRRFLSWPAYVWLGMVFILFLTVLGMDVVKGGIHVVQRLRGGGPSDPARRTWLARVLGAAAVALSGALGLGAVQSALGPVAVRKVRVRLPRLPSAQDGLSIVQLTDMHVGATRGRAFVEDVVARANALQPDVVAITGDLVDGSVADLRHAIEALRDLRARHGVYFVTGNHEYYSGASAWIAELGRIGIRVLRNERVTIGEGDAAFDLAGVDDYSAGRFSGLAHDDAVAKALGGRDPNREVVLLAHQPRSIIAAEKFGVGLQLSGHTHGGQIWPFTYFVHLQQPFVAGLHRTGESQIYVSRGTGYWGPPMRLGAPAEITQIVLESETPAVARTAAG